MTTSWRDTAWLLFVCGCGAAPGWEVRAPAEPINDSDDRVSSPLEEPPAPAAHGNSRDARSRTIV